MKVAEINTVGGVGSTGKIALSIAHALIEDGNEATVICGREKNADPIISRFQSKTEQYLHVGLTRLFDAHGYGSQVQTHRIIKFIRDFKPDLIHLHNIHGYYVNYKILFDFIKEYNVPVLWTLHDCWAFTGHCTYFSMIDCEKWQTLCETCPLTKDYPSSVLLANTKRNYNRKKRSFTGVNQLRLVTPSNWLANLSRQSYLSCYPVSVIHNGIDLHLFTPKDNPHFREKYHLQGKHILLSVANGLGKQKGLYEYIKLSSRLRNDEQFVLVGCEDNLHNLPQNILALGRTKNVDELIDIYSSADILLNLTTADNFPTVNLEALACGLPVITYRTGGSPESLTEKCGKIVDKYDLDGILTAINDIRRHPLKRNDCIERSKQFSTERMCRDYIEIIKKMLG